MRRPLMERVRSNTRSPLRYLSSLPLRYLAVPLVVWCIVSIVLLSANHLEANGHSHITGVNNKVSPNRMPPPKPLRPLRARIPCYGARGRLLTESPDDELQYSELNVSYPVPFMGSQRELGIDMTWMTADGRYGPYGFGEDRLSYSRSRVDWDAIDWGKLQDECYLQNAHRFPKPLPSVRIGEDKRFSLRSRTNIPLSPSWETFNNTRRTVLVLRSYEGFEYKPENMWSIRSIITEATLRTGGEYAVVMMVNVKNKGLDIFESAEKYEQAFEMLNIPPELRSITILWDERLVQSWYPELKDHSTRWQVNQPLQLFALHHPEFDHYWQIEMDQRYLGDVGKYLDALSEFSRYEPRKQALERTTYPFSEEVYGTYENLTMEVDRRNEGKSRAWGPVVVPEIEPIGPAAPSEHAEDDDFAWGVGEEADVVVTSFCADILETSWEYVGYIEGFQQGIFTPRWWCPPAIMRGSRTVLLTAHKAQLEHGLSIPGEAILPTFALWHSLKISYPPQPVYMHKHDPAVGLDDETSRLESEWRHPNRKPWFGDSPDRSRDGTSRADPRSFADRGLTYWWTSNYPRQVMDIWLNNDIKTPDMPQMLGLENDTIYMPNMVMHPVKTFKEFDKDY
ncbi:hypothetical protein B0I35DRAFT_453285 [Stachybotrys elegans]|uniref:Uncharacterized protein n=1 Tax=Stachybotrys elegans TaxID=80388 RepID=A0A8K0SJ73_9HYPO|nr:hypothetical protein B0I35DRAFT_453285 [Stachybotrys elegans]